MSKMDTVNLKGNDYALVPVRLKEFRQDNPKSDVKSTPHWNADGSLDFETYIIKDKSDDTSMSGNGWAHYSAKELANPKSYEKLQTVSVGRALSSVGYLNNGQIASTEEMEEFNDYKEQKKEEAIQLAIESFADAKTMDELKEAFAATGVLMTEEAVVEAKDKRKVELNASN